MFWMTIGCAGCLSRRRRLEPHSRPEHQRRLRLALELIGSGVPLRGRVHGHEEMTDLAEPVRGQNSFLNAKKEPRMVPASFDLCLANLNREASSSGTSIPSESLNPTARFLGSSMVYMTLIDRPLS